MTIQHEIILQEEKIIEHCEELGCPEEKLYDAIMKYSPLLREEIYYRYNIHPSQKDDLLYSVQ